MARLPGSEIERIKRETDLVALVQAAGVELRRHGANLVGRYLKLHNKTCQPIAWSYEDPHHRVRAINNTETQSTNIKWVDGIIARRGEVLTVTEQNAQNLWTESREAWSVYKEELERFFKAGYQQVGNRLVPPSQ